MKQFVTVKVESGKVLTYSYPAKGEDTLEPGDFVVVPATYFRDESTGIVLDIVEEPEFDCVNCRRAD